LSAGEKGEVIVGVVNHEYENVSYLFRAEIESRTIGEKKFQLTHNETLEFPFVFTVTATQDEKERNKLEFLSFKDYEKTHLNFTLSVYSGELNVFDRGADACITATFSH
jgi:uncharacterized membrane protein